MQKAKVKLEKRYKDKVDIVIKLGLKPFEDDYGTTYTHTPKIIVTTSKTLYQKGKTQKALPQSLLDKFFGRSIKFKEVDEIKSRSLNGADHSFISPKMTSEAIIQAVKEVVKGARQNLHEQFNIEHSTSDLRRAKRILEAAPSPFIKKTVLPPPRKP